MMARSFAARVGNVRSGGLRGRAMDGKTYADDVSFLRAPVVRSDRPPEAVFDTSVEVV